MTTLKSRRHSMLAPMLGALLCLPIAPSIFAHGHDEREDDSDVRVPTTGGTLLGSTTTDGRQFLGIPYAAPPVGALRWQPPHPVARWRGERAAQQFGSSCPQFGSPFGLQSFDEDCLYLNVYTPPAKRRDPPAPVMVWFHPGAFQFGEGDDYDPRKLVERGVIVVTVNYRLGALGFLSHPALTAESPRHGSGNYGIQDQQAALRWVRNNIARFGGNANNVTIFGDSAGGASVHAHLVSPGSRGLFQRAIIQSGAYSLTQPSLSDAEAAGESFATASGCAAQDLDCLRALPVLSVLTNQQPGILGFLPTVDGVTLPISVGEAFASGRFARVPVMEGSTHDEYRLFLPLFFDFQGAPLSDALYPVGIAIVLGVPPTAVPDIMAHYPLSDYSSASIALATLATDSVFACTRRSATENLSRHVPTYVYEFSDASAPQRHLPPASFPYGAAHESELQYLFDIFTTLPTIPLSHEQEQLSQAMVTYWTNFAYTGNPNVGPKGIAQPLWWRSNHTDYLHVLDTPTPRARSGADFSSEHHCDFWKNFDSQ